MEDNSKKISKENMDAYLKEYSVFRKMMDMSLYEKKYFGNTDNFDKNDGLPGNEAMIRCKMFEIRRFILSLGKCNEKVFLFYHYIHCQPVAKCGELMGISRRSAFRLKSRALEYACLKFSIYKEKSKNTKIY